MTFTGTNFTGATRVLFNGVSASFALSTNASLSDLQLTATVPPEATTGPITVETPHGNVTTSSNCTVLVTPRIAIRSVPGTNHVEVSWPLTAGFGLQRSDTFGPAAQWSSVSSFVSTRLSNGVRIVTVTNGAPSRVFRLYRP